MRVLVIVLLAVACRPEGYRVSTPRQISSIPLDSYVSFFVEANDGGTAPAYLGDLVTRCADPGICETRVVTTGRPHVDVIAKRVGTTQVIVQATAPVYVPHDPISMPVTITEVPRRARLAIGSALPTSVATFGDDHCVPVPDYYEPVFGEAHLFSCAPAIDGKWAACDLATPCKLSYPVCVEAHDRVVVGVRANGATEGTLTDRTCEPR